MRIPIRSTTLGLACFMLTACFTNYEFPRTYETNRLGAGNRFAAISIVSNKLTCSRIAILAFNNQTKKGPADFNVAETVTSAFSKVFEEVSNGAPVKIQADADRLNEIYTPGNIFYPIDYRNVRNYVSDLMRSANLDYLALYIGANDPDFIGDTKQRLDDIGCYTRGDSAPLYRYIAAQLLLFHKDQDRPIAQSFIREFEETGLNGSQIDQFLADPSQQKATATFVSGVIETSARSMFR